MKSASGTTSACTVRWLMARSWARARFTGPGWMTCVASMAKGSSGAAPGRARLPGRHGGQQGARHLARGGRVQPLLAHQVVGVRLQHLVVGAQAAGLVATGAAVGRAGQAAGEVGRLAHRETAGAAGRTVFGQGHGTSPQG
eukprot:Opistho-1_new@10284